MRTLFFLVLVGCPSASAPVSTPSATVDAGAADVVVDVVEAAPVASASASAPIETKEPDAGAMIETLNGPVSAALLARLAREADAIPRGELRKSPRADAERDGLIHKRFGSRCNLERTCGALWGIDCQAAVDGPYYYVRPRPDGLHEITVCGGACMGGRCTNCPPKNEGWTCETY